MNKIFLENYSLNCKEFLWFPLKTPYAKRHWQQKSLSHKCIACIESIPVLGSALSLIEAIAAQIFKIILYFHRKAQSAKLLNKIQVILKRDDIHQNRANFIEFDTAFQSWKKLQPKEKASSVIESNMEKLVQNATSIANAINALDLEIKGNAFQTAWQQKYQSLKLRCSPIFYKLERLGILDGPSSLQNTINHTSLCSTHIAHLGQTIRKYWKFKDKISSDMFNKISMSKQCLDQVWHTLLDLKCQWQKEKADAAHAQSLAKIERESANKTQQVQEDHQANTRKIKKAWRKSHADTQRRLQKLAQEQRRIRQKYLFKMHQIYEQHALNEITARSQLHNATKAVDGVSEIKKISQISVAAMHAKRVEQSQKKRM